MDPRFDLPGARRQLTCLPKEENDCLTGDVIENDLDEPQSLETTGPAKADAHSDQTTVPRRAVPPPTIEKQHPQAKNTQGEEPQKKVRAYGIHIVENGDNIWNIHFNILKEYYEDQGINVSPKADEPISEGLSSGVGKILKFSETMVTSLKVVTAPELITPP